MQPIDPTFNAAVLEMAARFCPAGYIGAKGAPDTFDKVMRTHGRLGGLIVVDNAFCDKSIYADAEINVAFRAWHDSAHIRRRADFSPMGEFRAFQQQVNDLLDWYGYSDTVARWIKLVDIEINQQGEYYRRHGNFVVDQMAFTRRFLKAPATAMKQEW